MISSNNLLEQEHELSENANQESKNNLKEEQVRIGNELFEKQFLISDEKQELLSNWINISFSNYTAHLHPALNYSFVANDNYKILALGNLYDYRNPSHSNQDIIECLSLENGLNNLLEGLSFLSGIYVILLEIDNSVFIIPDMARAKEAYIDLRDKNSLLVASSIPLLSTIREVQKIASNTEMGEFYHSNIYNSRGIQVGNTTAYEGIIRLKANHTFHFQSLNFKRFFPIHAVPHCDLETVAEKSSLILKGILKAISLRKRMLLPVTGGWESRLMMACTREFQNDVIYYLLKHGIIPQLKQDLIISKRLFKKFKIPFQLIQYSDHLTEEDKLVAYKSIDKPNERTLTYIFNAWKKLFPSYTNINGNLSEIARNEWGVAKDLNGKILATLAKYPNQPYCISLYNQWLQDNQDHFTRSGYQPLDMFYWEETASNSISKAYSQIDLGIEMISPFNCQHLINTLLSADIKYRAKQTNTLYKKMIANLWPELLEISVNPNFRKSVIRIMQKFGIYDLYRNALRRRL